MAPYLDALIGKLLALLQRGRRNVQEGALTAIAAVADTAEVRGVDSCRRASFLPSLFVTLRDVSINIALHSIITFPLPFHRLFRCRSTSSSITTAACPS